MSEFEKSVKEKKFNTDNKISRRDFVGNTLIGSGAALLSASAPTAFAQLSNIKPNEFKLGGSVPLPLNNLDKSWTGPGGVGDYATANGNTHAGVNAAHTFRNGDFEQQVKLAQGTGEEYDLVVVGAGFAGCSAAYTYLKKHPGAKILICDNHDMFGGEARHNEFEVEGYTLWAPQGSAGTPWFSDWVKKREMHAMWDELELPDEFEWQEAMGSDLKIPVDAYATMHLGWEQADLGWFHDSHKMAKNPWSNRFKEVPISDKTKQDLLWMEVYRQPPERADWKEWLDSMTYKEFLINEMGIDNQEVDNYLNPVMAAMGCGLGTDVVSALQAFNFISPGVVQYYRQLGAGDVTDYNQLAQFPGGNTGILRHIVNKLIPGIFGNKTPTLTEIISNPVDWKLMDNASQSVRIRLSSLVVNVVHDGPADKAKAVKVTYLKDGKMQRLVAKQVVMAGQQHLNKRVVTDLPLSHKQAMDQFMHAPIMVINVALTNWKFMDKMGVASVRWFDDELGWFTTLRRQLILDGEEPMPLAPDKPTVLTMYNSFCIPGLPVEQQTVAARMKMFSMRYADIEKNVREQFTKMFAEGGFDANRDIAGITVNRQGHAYVVTPPGFFFAKDGNATPSDVIRQRHGRVMFAHSELQGIQSWEGAVQEGERAAKQAFENS